MAAKHEILMVGEDTQPFVDLSEHLDDALYSVSFAQTKGPLGYLQEHALWHSAGVIVRLTGKESAEDFVPVFEAYPRSSFLFLWGRLPPDPAVERIAARNGAEIVDPETASPGQIIEQLLALIFHHKL